MYYFLWIPVAIAVAFLHAFLSLKSNLLGGIWFYILILGTINPTWAFVTKISKNVVLDSFIYDSVFTMSFAISMMYLTDSFNKFGKTQYFAIILILAGLFIFKKSG